jgi:hypothetical protein
MQGCLGRFVVATPDEVGTEPSFAACVVCPNTHDPTLPLGSYLEPWEQRCPDRPRTWAHVTGRVSVRPGQGAASSGCSSPGHGCGACWGRAGEAGAERPQETLWSPTAWPGGSPCQLRAAATAPDDPAGSLRAERAAPVQYPARGARWRGGRASEPVGERAPGPPARRRWGLPPPRTGAVPGADRSSADAQSARHPHPHAGQHPAGFPLLFASLFPRRFHGVRIPSQAEDAVCGQCNLEGSPGPP